MANENQSALDKSLFGSLTLRGILKTVLPALVLVVVAWIYFYPNALHGDVLQQSDMVAGQANGQELVEYQAKTGEKSWWTNALFSGMPTFQISPSYQSTGCISWLQSVLTLGTPSPVNYLILLFIGFYILMLAMRMRWHVALLGALAYGFSSYFIILIGAGHIWKLLALAYIPPTIAGVVLAYRGRYITGAAITALFAALQLMSNHIQMSYYSAFLVMALIIGYLVQAIKQKQLRTWLIGSAAVLIGALAAIGANAPSLYLTQKYAKESIRGGHSQLTIPVPGKEKDKQTQTPGLNKEYITQWSYGKDETFTLLVPNVKGGSSVKLVEGQMQPASLSDLPITQKLADQGELGSVSPQNLQYFTQYFGDQPMTNGPVYVGAIIFALFLLGCWVVRGPVKWALLAVTLLSIALSWGHNMMWLTDIFIDHFPMYNKFRAVASILIIAEITMPMLGTMALNRIITDPDGPQKYLRPAAVSFGISAGLCLLFALMPSIFGTYSASEVEAGIVSQINQQLPELGTVIATIRHSMVTADAWRSLIFLALGMVALWLYLSSRKIPAWAMGSALAVLVLADLYTVDKRYLDSDSFVAADYAQTSSPIRKRPADVTVLADTTKYYRVMDVQNFASATPSYFHKTIGGYHPAKLSRYNDLIEHQIAQNNMQVLNMLNARWIIVNDTIAQLNPQACGNAWIVDTLTYVNTADDEMRFLNNFSPQTHAVANKEFAATLGQAQPKQVGDTIRLTEYAPNRLAYFARSAKGGVAIFSDVYFPWGWTATVDGKEVSIACADYVLRAIRIPAGEHKVVFTFHPTEVDNTTNLAYASITLIFLLVLGAAIQWILSLRRDKTNDPNFLGRE